MMYPGEPIYLFEEYGVFVIQVQGKEILRTREQVAFSKFNELCPSMEQQFPADEGNA